MEIEVWKGRLERRDDELDFIKDKIQKEYISLDVFLNRVKTRVSTTGEGYKVYEGSTFTPEPFWKIVVSTTQRKRGKLIELQPKRISNYLYYVRPPESVLEVEGTGASKEKWREIATALKERNIQERLSPLKYIYVCIGSTWIAPFTIAHRYLVQIPVTVSDTGTLDLKYSYAENLAEISDFEFGDASINNNEDKLMRSWIKVVQEIWRLKKTEKQPDNIIEYINYYNKLANQKPKAIRVVYNEARQLYAAVLNPDSKTVFGLPLSKAHFKIRINDKILIEEISLQGILIDHTLMWVEVNSIDEAYWLSGILNSDVFRERSIKEVSGGSSRKSTTVPHLVNIPIRLINQKELTYDPENQDHQRISEIARKLEMYSSAVIREYLIEEKGMDFSKLDDTVDPNYVPKVRMDVVLRRLRKNEQTSNLLDELNYLVEKLGITE